MSKIYKNSPSVVDLTDGEIDLIAGGEGDSELTPTSSATHTRTCRIDSNGDGWCFLKED
jgi:hypothetical protein